MSLSGEAGYKYSSPCQTMNDITYSGLDEKRIIVQKLSGDCFTHKLPCPVSIPFCKVPSLILKISETSTTL